MHIIAIQLPIEYQHLVSCLHSQSSVSPNQHLLLPGFAIHGYLQPAVHRYMAIKARLNEKRKVKIHRPIKANRWDIPISGNFMAISGFLSFLLFFCSFSYIKPLFLDLFRLFLLLRRFHPWFNQCYLHHCNVVNCYLILPPLLRIYSPVDLYTIHRIQPE